MALIFLFMFMCVCAALCGGGCGGQRLSDLGPCVCAGNWTLISCKKVFLITEPFPQPNPWLLFLMDCKYFVNLIYLLKYMCMYYSVSVLYLEAKGSSLEKTVVFYHVDYKNWTQFFRLWQQTPIPIDPSYCLCKFYLIGLIPKVCDLWHQASSFLKMLTKFLFTFKTMWTPGCPWICFVILLALNSHSPESGIQVLKIIDVCYYASFQFQ